MELLQSIVQCKGKLIFYKKQAKTKKMHMVKILGGLAIVAAGIWLLSKDKSDKELGANEFDGIVKDALDKAEFKCLWKRH